MQTVFSPTLLNEFKVGYNAAKTRINGVAPTVNGLDLSAITLNISGNTANFNLPGQGTSAGTATPGGLVRANSATNGRGQPYNAESLHVHFYRVRSKLAPFGVRIETMVNVGYRLLPAAEAQTRRTAYSCLQ